MSEIIALTRLSIARSKTGITLAIAYFLVMHLTIIGYAINEVQGLSGLDWDTFQNPAVTTMALVLSVPLLAVTFAFFDFIDQADVGSSATGYVPWLLRTPVATWKLAAVPITLKTLWVLIVCGSAALTCRMFGIPLERWFIPALGIASLFVLACLVVWQPYRWTYTRVVLLAFSFLPAYGWLILCVSFALANHRSDLPTDPTSIATGWLIGLTTFVALTLLSLRAVRLARFNVAGNIGETRGWFPADDHTVDSRSAATATSVPRQRAAKVSPVRAIVNYDLAKLSGLGIRIAAALWCIVVLAVAAADHPDPSSIVFLMILLLFPGVFLNEWMISSLDEVFLPNMLATAPIRSSILVWTRQVTFTATWFASLLGLPIVLAAWHFTGASDAMSLHWNQMMQSQLGMPDAGWRFAAALFLLGILLVVRQTTWSVAANATGNKRYVYWIIAVKFTIGFAALSWFLFHFIRFPSWEAWSAWFWDRTAELPTLLPWLLAAKLAIVAFATALLHRSGLTSSRSVVALILGYAAITILCAGIFWRLLPSETVLLWHCIAATAVLMPYSRIALAPLCLAHNRHA